jgi:hypothetical protein
MGVEKRRVVRGGKISFSEGGVNIVFGLKYRNLTGSCLWKKISPSLLFMKKN